MLWKRLRHRKMRENDMLHHLLYATVSRDVKKVEELIECGIDPCSRMEDGTCPIHKAAVMESPYGALIISSMLRYGADPNVTTPTGLSSLHIAAMWGRVETIDVLIDNGADVFLKDDDDRSALDYADEAEENRNECIDALTRYRGTPCRRRTGSSNGCFLSKSRLNLEKIMGGDVSFSDRSLKIDVKSENSSFKADSIIVEKETQLVRHHSGRKRKSLRSKFSFSKNSRTNVAVQTDSPKNKQTDKKQTDKKQTDTSKTKHYQQTACIEKLIEKLDIDVPDGVPDKTVFESCDDNTINSFSFRDDSNCIISSTLLEDQTMYDSALSVQEMSAVEEEVRKDSSSTSSSSSKSSSSDDASSLNSALRQSTPITKETMTSSNRVETIAIVHMPRKKSENEECTTDTSSSKRGRVEYDIGKIASKSGRKQIVDSKDLRMTQHGSNSNLYIPVSIPTSKANNCNLSIKISIADAQNNKVYSKRIDALQIGSPTERTKKRKRIKNERKSTKQQHCYDEIAPLCATTFESAHEYIDNEVKYEEIPSVHNEQVMGTAPPHITDELKCNEVTLPPPRIQNRETSKSERSNIEDEIKCEQVQLQNEEVVEVGVNSSEPVCVETITPPLHNGQFLEAIPRPSIPHHISEELNSNILSSPPHIDDPLEPSLYNITKELNNDVNNDATNNGIYSEISDISESFINLDAQDLTTYGDRTSEAKIELNQSTIDYISSNVNNNVPSAEPTIDYINTDTNILQSETNTVFYANTNFNNNAPVSELVHYFEEKTTGGESDISRQLSGESDISRQLTGESDISRQFVEDGVTRQFDSKNVDESVVTRQTKRINSVEEKRVTRMFENDDNIVPCQLEEIEQQENIITRQYVNSPNSSIEENMFTPKLTERGPVKNRTTALSELRSARKDTSTRQLETENQVEQNYVTRQLDNWNNYYDKIPTHQLLGNWTVTREQEIKRTEGNKAALELKKRNAQNNMINRQHVDEYYDDHNVDNVTALRKHEQEHVIQTQEISTHFHARKDVTYQRPASVLTSYVNTSDNVDSSEMYEESSEENETVISAHNCVHSCGEDDEEESSNSSAAYDETDDVDIIKPPVVEVFRKPRGLLAEYADVCVNYGWKDVCGFSREFEDTMLTVPSRIMTLHDDELRMRLQKIGVTAHQITDKTRKIYQRHVVKMETSNHLKPNGMYEDFTSEMAQVLCGNMDMSDESGGLLESEMRLQFTNPEKFTWREGTQNTSLNYLLLDPRVTNNLPGRTDNMSFLETFKTFVASIFFVGRGKKCRPYEHLEEAARHRTKPQNNKVRMIHDIWASGLGVVSLHVFNNIIPVEAFTREACMIEAMGLSRLTNTKHGDLYGLASSWNTKKQRLLGIYILMKAMESFLSDGEYQIRMKDLESNEIRNSKNMNKNTTNVNKDDKMRAAIMRAASYPSAHTCALQPPRLSLNGASLREPFFCSK